VSLLNQFSYPLLVLVALLVVFGLLWRTGRLRLRYGLPAAAGLLALALVVFLALRPTGDNIASAAEVERLLTAGGRPTLIQFYSAYCTGCLAVSAAVDELVGRIQPQMNIVRVDIHTPAGRDLRRRFDFSFTPEFVLFDRQGQEIWRDHVPPSAEVLQRAGLSS
jgi:thiol-disulfide isomerase/thioredoxin